MIGPSSKHTYFKIKLINMVTKNFIRTEHTFRSQFENKFYPIHNSCMKLASPLKKR